MRAVVIKCKLADVSLRKDGSASIKLVTPLLSPEDVPVLHAMLDAEATALLQCEEGGPSLHESKAVWEDKTPSQKLRGVLYVLWEQEKATGEAHADFDVFYRDRMGRLVEWVKKKLPKK